MTNVLSIKSSIFSGQGQSSQLTERFIQLLTAGAAEVNVVERDLALNPVPHLDGQTVSAFMADSNASLNEQQKQGLELSNTLIDELKSADVLLLGVPMYNFGIPSTLKAWIDHVARAGITFRYTENGPEGLVSNIKKAYILAARGGVYQGTAQDSQTQYMKDVLAFLGINEVEFIYAEALNMGQQETAIADAHQKIEKEVSEIV